ncbi:hypothetical protein ASPVEDRAFT_42648 [Aspergillus versicolor CBS 583.65]|uniref:Uncharacterized protein n=1 Tax=Aspergillus versicolor CBS 583.65 TaxID=1036611 RepID=A0A1L9PNW6_ASPVE|nr:uncharacterized protein ASPVEDRAFT_42648 [Aspergillus versicolor CBS 583.65]OJJ03136.1 hypothetical protein ASPVEDRAFT_42648 [Aspergillus versicolor CBS 583.65]
MIVLAVIDGIFISFPVGTFRRTLSTASTAFVFSPRIQGSCQCHLPYAAHACR